MLMVKMEHYQMMNWRNQTDYIIQLEHLATSSETMYLNEGISHIHLK